MVPVNPAFGIRVGQEPSLSSRQKRALELLEGEIELQGQVLEPSNRVPAFTKAVTRKIWREACHRRLGIDSDKPEARRQAFNRAVDDLLAKRFVDTWEDWFWPTRPSRRT